MTSVGRLLATMITVKSFPIFSTCQLQCASSLRAPYACSRNGRAACDRTTCAAGRSCLQTAVSSLACTCIALVPTAAGAYNVRLEDVENENLQSGMQSQIKSTSLHIACRVGPQNSTQCQQHLCLLLLFVISKHCLMSMCDNTTHC